MLLKDLGYGLQSSSPPPTKVIVIGSPETALLESTKQQLHSLIQLYFAQQIAHSTTESSRESMAMGGSRKTSVVEVWTEVGTVVGVAVVVAGLWDPQAGTATLRGCEA